MTERYSTPPSIANLNESTKRFVEANDTLEKRVGSEPLPAAVAIATLDLTPEQKLAVVREIYAECRMSGGSTVLALHRYEDKARAELAGRAPR